jgi:hypothetical protein
MADIINVPTCDLVTELAKREGVKELVCNTPEDNYCACVNNGKTGKSIIEDYGPARILVVID